MSDIGFDRADIKLSLSLYVVTEHLTDRSDFLFVTDLGTLKKIRVSSMTCLSNIEHTYSTYKHEVSLGLPVQNEASARTESVRTNVP